MMDSKIFLLIGIPLVFLVNLDLVKGLTCLRCKGGSGTKCLASEADPRICPPAGMKMAYCYAYFENEDSTDGAERDCDQNTHGTIPNNRCNSAQRCYCTFDKCNDKDSFKKQDETIKPGPGNGDESTAGGGDPGTPAPPPPPSGPSDDSTKIGFNLFTTLAMIIICTFLY